MKRTLKPWLTMATATSLEYPRLEDVAKALGISRPWLSVLINRPLGTIKLGYLERLGEMFGCSAVDIQEYEG